MMTILWTVVAVWLGLNLLVGVIMLIYVFGRKPAPSS